MITKQRLISELKLFLHELQKTNEELEAEAAVRRDILRVKYYIKHPGEVPTAGHRRGTNYVGWMTASQMFYSDRTKKAMKNSMYVMLIFMLSLPVTVPLMAVYVDNVQAQKVSSK